MKTLIRIHVVTAILGWILMVTAFLFVAPAGGLPAIASFVMTILATGLTGLDLAAVVSWQKGRKPIAATISCGFWALVTVIFFAATVSALTGKVPGQPWEMPLIGASIALFGCFKIVVASKLMGRQNLSGPT